MLNPFQQPQLIKAEVFMSMPATFRKKSRSAWSDPNRNCYVAVTRSRQF